MPIEEARKCLGDLVIKAMAGETTILTRYGKPVAQITPYAALEPAMTVSLSDLRDQINVSITANGPEHAEGIDVEAIAEEIRDTYGLIDINAKDSDGEPIIDHDEYWAIVRKHDATQQY